MSEIALLNGRVITLDDNNNICEAIAIRDNRIVCLGTNKEVMDYFDNPKIVDLQGKTVLPGFIETDMNMIKTARSLIELDLKNVRSIDEFEEILYAFSREKKFGEWILGSGWSGIDIFEGRMPNKNDIDKVVSSRPVCLEGQDGHSIVLNSLAIELLQLDRFKDIIDYKKAPRNESGEYTGLFLEEWIYKILNMIMETFPDIYFEMAIERLNNELVSNGLTFVNDTVVNYPIIYKIYKEMMDKGKLNVRIRTGILEKYTKYEDFNTLPEYDKLLKGPLRYYMDGSFGSRTALLFKGYEDEPDNTGIQNLSVEELYLIIENSLKNNIQIAIHAIGDKAVAIILDVYERVFEKYPNRNVRNRIEHIQIIRSEDIERFKKLGIIASFQPVFNLESKLTLNRIGIERIKDTYRYNTFIKSGVKVIFNSDAPFGAEYMKKNDGTHFKGFEPLIGIHCAVNEINLNKDETVSVLDAIECYTKNAAFANKLEDKLGTIEKNKLADLVVLYDDPFEIESMNLKDIKIAMTIIDGRIVFNRDDEV